MDGRGFDALSRRLAFGSSRRSVVRGALGGAAAFLGTRAGLVTAAPLPKSDICHYDADTGTYHLINISDNAYDSHIAHGDYAPGTVREVASFSMAANNPNPVDSGVFLNDGETVDVTITGTAGWCCGDSSLDANGQAPCGFLGIPFNCGSVVGAIGAGNNIFTDYSQFFTVGTSATVTASGDSGNLVLQFVDGCPGCYSDNLGTLWVSISRASYC